MAQMISVEEGPFRVNGNLGVQAAGRNMGAGNRSSIAVKILSEIASILEAEGYKVTKPKRWKRENARALCILGKHFGYRSDCISARA
jgi:hypothetical protein